MAYEILKERKHIITAKILNNILDNNRHNKGRVKHSFNSIKFMGFYEVKLMS